MRKALLPTLVLALVAGCGGADETGQSDDPPKVEPRPVALKVDPAPQDAATSDTVTVRGEVTPSSDVTVAGTRAQVRGGRFSARVPLKTGPNQIEVTARRPGYRAERERLKVERREPPPAAVPTQEMPQQQSQPNVNPQCPPGQEPNTTGGCEAYDERDGQVEPKINDERCYSDRPPAGCF